MFAGEWNVLSRPNNKVVGPNGVLEGGTVGAGVFTPSMLDGLALWLDAIDQNSLLASDGSVIEDGEAVALWSDKSGNSAENALLLNGVAGNYASIPDSAAIPNDTFDFIFRITPPTWASSDLIFGHGAGSGTRAIGFRHLTAAGSRGLRLAIYFDGINATIYDTTADLPFSTFESGWIRVTRDGTTGDVTFYSSTDGVSWAQVGAVVSGPTGAFFDSSEPFWLGAFSATGAYANTRFNYAELRTSIGGAATVQIDFSTASKLATSFVCTTGQTVTINSTGATGARISGARDLYQGTVANRPVFLKYNGEKYGYLIGSFGGNYFSTPSSTANNITGEIDLIAKVALDDWTPSSTNAIISKRAAATTDICYQLRVDSTTGEISFLWSPDGTAANSETLTSGAAPVVSDYGTLWIRFTRTTAGVYSFKTSTDGVTWSTLGSGTGTSGSLHSAATALEVGGSIAGTALRTSGRIYSASVWEGNSESGGTLKASFNAEDYSSGGTVVSSATGETWTLNGVSHIVQRTGLYFDGINDYLKSASFSLSQPENDYIIGSLVTWTSGDTLRGGVSTGFGTYQTGASPGLQIYAGTGVAANNTLELKTDGIITSIFNEASSSLRINRGTASTGNPGASNSNGITLCASEVPAAYANAFIHEVLIYDTTAQDTATQDRVALYAGKKWGIAV